MQKVVLEARKVKRLGIERRISQQELLNDCDTHMIQRGTGR